MAIHKHHYFVLTQTQTEGQTKIQTKNYFTKLNILVFKTSDSRERMSSFQ